MPTSVYKSLKLGDLNSTGVVIQLANRSITRPTGVLEDVLVQVNELIFPADFYILDMEDETSSNGPTLILGRPFLKTAKTKIDVHAGTLSMEFGEDVVQFNIFDAMKHPSEDNSLFLLDVIDFLVDDFADLNSEYDYFSDFADFSDCEEFKCEEIKTAEMTVVIEDTCVDLNVAATESKDPSLPSIVQPPALELKPLPSNMKYAYLEANEKLPVILANNLQQDQEEKLLQVLRNHKKAIGWSLADISGISPSTCIHRILLEDGARTVRQPQTQSQG